MKWILQARVMSQRPKRRHTLQPSRRSRARRIWIEVSATAAVAQVFHALLVGATKTHRKVRPQIEDETIWNRRSNSSPVTTGPLPHLQIFSVMGSVTPAQGSCPTPWGLPQQVHQLCCTRRLSRGKLKRSVHQGGWPQPRAPSRIPSALQSPRSAWNKRRHL